MLIVLEGIDGCGKSTQAQMLAEASADAARVREEADIEASRRRTDASADAEAELAMAKQQGREMVNEARAYRERVLSELARRRELAREQIDVTAVNVSFPKKRVQYLRVLDQVLFQAKLKSEARLDEAGKPFLWISPRRG